MLIAILLAQAVVQAPPPPPAGGGAWHSYLQCIRARSAAWSGKPDAPSHLDAVVAACDDGVAPAAVAFAQSVRDSPVFPAIAAAYRNRHGTELAMTPAIERLVRDAGRDGAARLLAGRPFAQAELSITFDGDGVVVPK